MLPDKDVPGILQIFCGRAGAGSSQQRIHILRGYRLFCIMPAGTAAAHKPKQLLRLDGFRQRHQVIQRKRIIGNSILRTDGNTMPQPMQFSGAASAAVPFSKARAEGKQSPAQSPQPTQRAKSILIKANTSIL